MGLTPQEIVGSAGMGGGQGTTASFGNFFEQGPLMQQAQIAFEAEQKALDRQNALDLAEIQFGKGSPADRTADAALTKVQQDKIRLEFEQMHKTREFKIALERHKREMTTMSADFLLYKAMLSMGPDNLRTSALANQLQKQGLDILDPNGKPIPEKRFMKIMSQLRMEGSSTYREIMGTLKAAFDLQGAVDLPESRKDRDYAPKKGALYESVLGNKNKYTPGTPIPLQ